MMFKGVHGDFRGIARNREMRLEVDTSRGISPEILYCDQARAKSRTNRKRSGCIRKIGAPSKNRALPRDVRAGMGRTCYRGLEQREEQLQARVNPSP